MLASALNIDSYELNEVIKTYTNALDLLDDYYHQRLIKPKGNETIYKIEYDEARRIIDSMKFKNDSNLFGVEKEEGKGLSTHDLTDLLYLKLVNDYTKEELVEKFDIIENRVTDLEINDSYPNIAMSETDEAPATVKNGDIWYKVVTKDIED
jgi:aspartyl/asparaginyl-tRNA synthetase